MSSQPLILVDGSSYLYRAFHAMYKADLRTSTGMPVGAVRTVTTMLKSLCSEYEGSTVAVIFDAKGKTFRDDIYPEYKAQRPPMPDDLRQQIQPIHDIIDAMGLPRIVIDGVEADDVIGTLAHQANEKGIEVIISTGDKDMAQLVTEHVTLINTMTDTVMDCAGVEEKFGIGPELIIDYLALMGDKVDNIPGVPGVGEKTTLGLLQGIGSLDAIYGDLDKVATLGFRGAKTMSKKLIENKDSAYLSYTLATIKLDVELDFTVDSLAMAPANHDDLMALFHNLEFKTWVNELASGGSLLGSPAKDKPEIEKHYEIVLDEATFNQWLEKIQQAELTAFDTETTSLNYMEARMVGVCVSVTPGEAAYIPFGHTYLDAPEQLDQDWVLAQLKPWLESDDHKKVGQNLKYDRSVLLNHGITLKGIAFDTMLESYVLDSLGRHDMDTLAEKYLGEKTIKFEDIAGKGAKQLTFDQIAVEEAGPYAAEDADITLRLHQEIWPQVEKEEGLNQILNELEQPLLTILSDIERGGVLVDAKVLGQQSIELGERLKTLEEQAYVLADQEFNLGSTKQLGEILFNKLELPVIKKTPKGQPSTAEAVLEELANDYELPALIMEHRSLSKLKNTYTDKLPQMINPATGRIHTSYHQAVTATGRLSSSDPNLQNIPIRTEEGRKVRHAFIAPAGYKLVAADYSQIELRIMAHLSGDEGLCNAFAQGLDVHKATAAEVFGVSLDEVSTDQRRSAKAINFGLIYGMSAFGLAKQLDIGRHQAQEYIDLYFARYPSVLEYMDSAKETAKADGYVQTLWGRRLHLPDINASNGMRRQGAERAAINAPMQGTAADIIKKAMIDVQAWLSNDKVDARIVMQVHDELVLEVAEDQLDTVVPKLQQLMSDAAALDVPLLVEAGVGDNWEQAH